MKKMNDELEEKNLIINDEIENYYNIKPKWESYTLNISEFMQLFEYEDIIIPDYQRSYIWKKKMADRYIESILMGLPIPGVVISKIKTKEGSKFYIIDGLQRLTSLNMFIRSAKLMNNNKVEVIKNAKKLKLDNQKWNRSFADLDLADRKQIQRARMNVIEIDNDFSGSDEILFSVFERLNTGGVKLRAQQLRKAIFSSDFMSNLYSISDEHNLYKILRISETAKNNDTDVEILLRMIAVWHVIFKEDFKNEINYTGNLKKLLNDFSLLMQKKEGEWGQSVDSLSLIKDIKATVQEFETFDKPLGSIHLEALIMARKLAEQEGKKMSANAAIKLNNYFNSKKETILNQISDNWSKSTSSKHKIKARVNKILEICYEKR